MNDRFQKNPLFWWIESLHKGLKLISDHDAEAQRNLFDSKEPIAKEKVEKIINKAQKANPLVLVGIEKLDAVDKEIVQWIEQNKTQEEMCTLYQRSVALKNLKERVPSLEFLQLVAFCEQFIQERLMTIKSTDFSFGYELLQSEEIIYKIMEDQQGYSLIVTQHFKVSFSDFNPSRASFAEKVVPPKIVEDETKSIARYSIEIRLCTGIKVTAYFRQLKSKNDWLGNVALEPTNQPQEKDGKQQAALQEFYKAIQYQPKEQQSAFPKLSKETLETKAKPSSPLLLKRQVPRKDG